MANKRSEFNAQETLAMVLGFSLGVVLIGASAYIAIKGGLGGASWCSFTQNNHVVCTVPGSLADEGRVEVARFQKRPGVVIKTHRARETADPHEVWLEDSVTSTLISVSTERSDAEEVAAEAERWLDTGSGRLPISDAGGGNAFLAALAGLVLGLILTFGMVVKTIRRRRGGNRLRDRFGERSG